MKRLLMVFVASLISVVAVAVEPPKEVRARQHDMQAVLIEWEAASKANRFYLYAARDSKTPDFYLESEKPLTQTFVIWDAPREGLRDFVFYVTAVDAEGKESKPSRQVRVRMSQDRTKW